MYTLAFVALSLVGVTLGLLGGGGSILTVPVLVYALNVDEKAAIASSLVVVGLTSAAALVPYARRKEVVWKIGLTFAGPGMIGAFVGGRLAAYVPSRVLLLMFAGMMVATAVVMFRGRPAVVGEVRGERPLAKIVVDGLGVGLVTGLVGAGGGFLVVPALTLLGGLPMRQAVGTSLLVIALKSGAGYLGHAGHVNIDWNLTLLGAGAAVLGSFVGGALSQRIDQNTLRRGFASFVLVMAAYLVYKQAS